MPEIDAPVQPDPGSVDRVEADRWVGFYRELLELEKSALQRMRQLAARASQPVRDEAIRSNIDPLQRLIEDLQARLDEWEARVRELEAS
jgi:hypothetical protein